MADGGITASRNLFIDSAFLQLGVLHKTRKLAQAWKGDA